MEELQVVKPTNVIRALPKLRDERTDVCTRRQVSYDC